VGSRHRGGLVNIFASLLPGLRDLRAPLAGGALWIAVLAEIAFPRRAAIESALSTEWRLWASLSQNLASQLIVLPFVCYIVGLIGASLFNGLVKVVSSQLRKWVKRGRVETWAVRSSGQPQPESFARWFYRKSRTLRRSTATALSVEGRARLDLVIRNSLAVAPEGIARLFPAAVITRDLPATLLQLSKEAPDQFQQIDRLRGEVEFRIAVAFPLFFFVALVSLGGPWWVVPLLLVPVGLAWPSLRIRQESNDLLITAAYLGYVEPPVLSAVRTALERDGITRESAVVALPWMKNFLMTVGAEDVVIKDVEQRDAWEQTDQARGGAVGGVGMGELAGESDDVG
jgi:hypothetical protein